MVSPCKQKDTQNQHAKYNVSCRKNKTKSLRGHKARVEKEKPKPFASKIVYLDLKSRKESANLEAALKSLGAVVAVFLDRSVTHVVSDRLVVGPSGSSTVASPAASVSPHTYHSPCTSERNSVPKSRGAAMLERVSDISNTGCVDPITLALQWRIPVLSAAKLWLEISRLQAFQYAHKKFSSAKPSSLVKADFVKIESLVGTMTRRPFKQSVNSEEDATGGKINKKSSLLCNGHGPTGRTSNEDLKVQCNGLSSGLRSSKLLSPSGSDVLPLPTQRRSTRRASASWCGSTRELSQLSPPLSPPPASPSSPSESELGVTLRPKGTLWLPVALIGTTAEEHGNSIRRPGGSDASLSSLDASKPRRKKLSPEEKLLQDNKDYFKMEVLHTKLRSSGPKQPNHVNNVVSKKIPVKSKKGQWNKTKERNVHSVDYEALIVESKIMKVNGVSKPKRTRRSELMKLCDEAESFMFGESSRQSAASAVSAVSGVESEEERREDDNVAGDEPRPRRKRRSHVESFIHDNLDYYKFETPGTRLRNQGSTGEKDTSVSTISEDGRDVMFSFQTVPSKELWYDVFCRQDEGREEHFPVISDPANQPFLLPYELPRPVVQRPEPGDYYVKRRQRLAHILAQNHPRKSPRCHASTLAILSSLKKRKRRSSASGGNTDPESSFTKDDPLGLLGLTDDQVEDLPLLDPVDVEPSAAVVTPTRRKKTEERLTLCAAPTVPIAPDPTDVLHLVTSCMENGPFLALTDTTAPLKLPHGPRRRRKARFNKTGWDKAKTRVKKMQKGKGAPANTGIAPENIVTSPRRSVNGSPTGVAVSPCVVRVRKLSNSYCHKLVLKRRRRPVSDYSWTTRKR